MTTRSQRSAKERETRSRAVKRLAGDDLLRGSLVEMQRTCGKSGCRCQRGDKHRALYLSIKSGGKRSMVYIPPGLEPLVREWVRNAKELDKLLHRISEHCFQQLLRQKEQTIGGKRSGRKRGQRKGQSP